MLTDMDALIRPRTIAVVGASARRNNNGNVVLTNLREAGFNGEVTPVHAEAAEIEGYAGSLPWRARFRAATLYSVGPAGSGP